MFQTIFEDKIKTFILCCENRIVYAII